MIPVLAAGLALGSFMGSKPDDPQPVRHEEQETESMYAYSTLNSTEKQVYDQIVYAIENRKDYISLSTTDQNVMEKAYWAVRYDHCEYFWTDSYEYQIFSNHDGEATAIYFRPHFTMDEEQQRQYQKRIDDSARAMLSDLPADADDYEKALYVYKTLIGKTEYVEDSQQNQNIISTFVNHKTVCQGYAYGAQYLLNMLGVPCTTVFGTSDGINHSWNLIQIDGEYYYMDVTWGETEYWNLMEGVGETGEDDMVNYSYFGVSDADENFMSRHQPFDYIILPECTAVKDNYFVREGLYFDSWDPDAAGAAIRRAFEAGETSVSLKFSSDLLYDKAVDYFIGENHWSQYCDLNQISYVDGLGTNVLIIRFSI